MEITEVRIKLMEDSDDRLQGFCSITFDNAFVVRDLKIIDGTNGPFVAMPSRKLTCHCPHCRSKNHLRANYCNQCGSRLKHEREHQDSEGRLKLYADIAHPINSACREMIQKRVIEGFREELERSKQPGYVSRYDDYFDIDEDFESVEPPKAPLQGPHRRAGETAGEGRAAEERRRDGEASSPPNESRVTPHTHLKRQQPPATPSTPPKPPGAAEGDFGAGVFD